MGPKQKHLWMWLVIEEKSDAVRAIYIGTWNSRSIQFSPSFVSHSLRPQNPSVPGSLLITNSGVHPNPCPLCWWYHPTISSSVVPFFSCPHSFPASGSFPMSQLSASGGQSIGASASTSVLPMNIQSWFPLGLTGLIALLSKGLSRVFSSTTAQKHKFLGAQLSLWSNSHIHTGLMEKLQLWLYGPLSAKWCPCFLIRYLGLS